MNGTHSALTFITGGARSGKSAHAVQLGKATTGPVVYLATAEPIDDEMRERISAHQAERPVSWETLEEPIELAKTLLLEVETGSTVIVDCLTVWLGNVLARGSGAGRHEVRRSALEELHAVLGAGGKMDLTLIVISNEVGGGIVPADPSTRLYRDLLGEVNQGLAAVADEAILMVAGLPLPLPSPPEHNVRR